MGEATPAVILDLDGVVLDAFDAHVASWRRLAEEHGHRLFADDVVEAFGRTSRETLLDHWDRELHGEELAALAGQRDALWRDLLAGEGWRTAPGAVALIEAVAAAGLALAVTTTRPHADALADLERLGCAEHVAAILTPADAATGPPAPDLLTCAAARLGVEPARCVAVAGGAHGIRAARAAGMVVVAVVGSSGPACRLGGADVVATSLRQLSPATLTRLVDRRDR